MKKLLTDASIYIKAYICFSIITLFLSICLHSNSIVVDGTIQDIMPNTYKYLTWLFILHEICLGVLCGIAFMIGSAISKKWIVLFSLIASICDLTLVYVYHLYSISFPSFVSWCLSVVSVILHILVVLIGYGVIL